MRVIVQQVPTPFPDASISSLLRPNYGEFVSKGMLIPFRVVQLLRTLVRDFGQMSAVDLAIGLAEALSVVQHCAERPRIHKAMVGQLNQGKRIELLSEPANRDAAPNCGGRESGLHVAERRRGRDGSCDTQSRVGGLVAIHRDAIASQQPLAVLSLALAEELKIEVPDFFNALNPLMRPIFSSDHLLQARRIGILTGLSDGIVHFLRHLQKAMAQSRN